GGAASQVVSRPWSSNDSNGVIPSGSEGPGRGGGAQAIGRCTTRPPRSLATLGMTSEVKKDQRRRDEETERAVEDHHVREADREGHRHHGDGAEPRGLVA